MSDVKPLKLKAGHEHQFETGDSVGVIHGGTGLTTIASGRIPYATSLDTIGTSEDFTYDGFTLRVSDSGNIVVASLYGGEASGDDLVLNSTAHATRGKIYLGASSGYDEVNVRLGIGTTAPAKTLEVISTSAQIRAGYDAARYIDLTVGSAAGWDISASVHATPGASAINGVGGTGSNVAGGSLTVAGGKATGNATGGSVVIQASTAGSSGSSLQSLGTIAEFSPTAITLAKATTISAGSLTVSAGQITTSAQSGVSTLTRATSGTATILDLHNSQSGAANNGSQLRFTQLDSGGTATVFAAILGRTVTATDGAEDGLLAFATTKAGTSQFNVTISKDGYLGVKPNSVATAATQLELEETKTLSSSPSDDYAACITLDPGYSGAYTVTRHNYLDIQNPSTASSAVVTDAALARFDAAAGSHKCVDSGSTKSSPGTVSAWIKVNINGTIYYVPCYTSKTS